MANYSFNYRFFFPTGEEGNEALTSLDSRISEALKLLSSKDDYIIFDDGVKCQTAEEIKVAVTNRIKSTIDVTPAVQEEQPKKSSKKTNIILIIIAIFLFLIVGFCLDFF